MTRVNATGCSIAIAATASASARSSKALDVLTPLLICHAPDQQAVGGGDLEGLGGLTVHALKDKVQRPYARRLPINAPGAILRLLLQPDAHRHLPESRQQLLAPAFGHPFVQR